MVRMSRWAHVKSDLKITMMKNGGKTMMIGATHDGIVRVEDNGQEGEGKEGDDMILKC